MELEGRVAVLSGASGGLGGAVAEALGRAGVRLVVVGSRQAASETLAADLGERLGVATLGVGVDLVDPSGAVAVVEAALGAFGQLDVVVNMTGGFAGGKPVVEADANELDRMLDLNLRTAWNLCRAALPPMLAQGWGRIVTIGARDAVRPRAGFAAYGLSKAAVVHLTESLAAETREHGVTVNAILPSLIDTPANRTSMPDADFGRWVPPAAIAETVRFLCGSGAGAVISGAVLPLYGKS